MLYDSEMVLGDRLKNNSFFIDVDEPTVLTNKCYVIALVRFVNEGEIEENFLRCKELAETSN